VGIVKNSAWDEHWWGNVVQRDSNMESWYAAL